MVYQTWTRCDGWATFVAAGPGEPAPQHRPRFYAERDDGLRKRWIGRVWLNPPYGGLQVGFITKLIEEHDAGRVPVAIMLLNGYRYDAHWFKPLWDFPLCFITKRLQVYNPCRLPGAQRSAVTGSVAVYVGHDFDTFVEVFGRFGEVVKVPGPREWHRRFSRHPALREPRHEGT